MTAPNASTVNRLAILGKGRAGQALATLLTQTGQPVTWWWSRRDGGEILALAPADVIIIAVADQAIHSVAQELSKRPSAPQEIWLHLSGLLSGDILRTSPNVPAATGSFHILQALDRSTSSAGDLHGVTAGLEGDPTAVDCARQLAARLGMTPRTIQGGTKPLYHAAAVSVAGHAVALFAQAQTMLSACGIDEATSRAMLQPLMSGAIQNLSAATPSDAITGPSARGDATTIASHLEALDRLDDPSLAQTYRLLAATAIVQSSDALTPEQVHRLRQTLAHSVRDDSTAES